MNSKNESFFCEVLPEVCRVYEQKRFADSLNIYVSDLKFGHSESVEKSDDETEIRTKEGICVATFENCKAVKQKRMTETDEMMFGIFGIESMKTSDIPPEVSALNARLILPKASDQYVSHVEIRNYEIPLNPSFQDIFYCSPSEIKLCQKEKNEIYLHVNLEKEYQTSRTALFEGILLMLEELKVKKEIKRIKVLCIPFVHFGKVRICVTLDEKTKDIRVEIFNSFGSLFGFIEIPENESRRNREIEEKEELFLTEKMLRIKYSTEDENSEESEKESEETSDIPNASGVSLTLNFLITILQNKMNLLKPLTDGVSFTPLPYLGVDSLRLAELEFHIANSQEFKKCQLKPPYLIPFKTLSQVAEFLDMKRKEITRNGILPSVTTFVSNNSKVPDIEKEQIYFHEIHSKFRIPLSCQQKRILFIREFEKEYLNPTTFSQFDESVLLHFSIFQNDRVTEILNSLIMIHSILRTQYEEDFQFILSGTECFVMIKYEERDISYCHNLNVVTAIQCCLRSDQYLHITFNHISIDGRSLQIFYRQFKEMLSSRRSNRQKSPLQYRDYCRSNFTTSTECLKYWKKYLNLEQIELEKLPSDFPGLSDFSASSYIYKSFPTRLQRKFDDFCHQFSFSRFELFLGILEISLHRVFGVSAPFLIGFAVDLRTFPYFETIGCFTNVLLYISLNFSTNQLTNQLKNCQKSLRETRSHGDIPYESLVKLLGTEGNLFQVFVVSDIVETDLTSEVISRSERRVRFEDETIIVEIVQDSEDSQEKERKKIAKYPMTFYLRQFGNGQLQIEVEYASELFKSETIDSILEEMFRIVNSMSSVSKDQKTQSLLNRFTERKPYKRSDFPSSTVSQIIFSNNSKCDIRYLQKNSSVHPNEFSSFLLKNHMKMYCQLLNEYPILINIPRSPDLILATLGAWKSGFYPVPLHRDATNEQIQKTCDGLGLKMEGTAILRNLDNFNSIKIKQAFARRQIFNRTALFDFAYVTSTSGSTGTPKLVGTSFEGHSNLARQYTTSFQLSSRDIIGQVVDPSFDIFFADIVKTFTNGARLLLSRDSIPTSSELLECSNVYLMPAFISRLPDLKCLNNLETLQYGGEPIASQFLKLTHQNNKELNVWQEFGLTEQTVYSTRKKIRPLDIYNSEEIKMIGDPYDNIQIEVNSFSGSNNSSENCIRGQLVLKGIGLMRGYFDVTKCVLDQFNTGDEVRKLKNGDIVFIGRKDLQVKIRGHRVDLFEIECTALSSKLLEYCSCIAIGNQKIILFYKLKSSNNDQDQLSKFIDYLEKQLLSYKMPSQLIPLSSFPLTRTGKIDKKQLANMVMNSENSCEIVREQKEIRNIILNQNDDRTGKLHDLLKKWLQHYSNGTIKSIDDNIFSDGIDSISVMLTMQKMRSAEIEIPVKMFFKLKTIRKIVDWVLETPQSSEDAKEVLESKTVIKEKHIPNHYINLNHIQQRILFLSRMSFSKSNSNNSFYSQFSIELPSVPVSHCVLLQCVNTIIMGNRMLRSKLQRIQGEYRFILLSGTECFYRTQLDSHFNSHSYIDPFVTRIWSDKNETRLFILIHHIIFDGRSLQILEEQMKQTLKNGNNEILFQNVFCCEMNQIPRHLFIDLQSWKSMFPSFLIGSESSRIEFNLSFENNLEAIPVAFKISHAYCMAICKVFQISTSFPIATTFVNRTENNWNTVSMFANTLPLMYYPEQDLHQFCERFFELAENSNVPLNEVLTRGSSGVGNFADFAFNSHKSIGNNRENNGVCQFPMVLTVSETENLARIEFDNDYISQETAENLRNEILKLLGCGRAEHHERVNFVEVFQLFLNSKVSENTDFFHSGGHSLTAMKLIDYLSDLIGIEVPLKLIFEFRTPKKLETAVNSLKVNRDPVATIMDKTVPKVTEKSFPRALSSEGTQSFLKETETFKFPLSRQQEQMFYLAQLTSASLEYQLPFIQPFPSTVSPSEIHRSLLMTIQEQNIFRTLFKMDPETGEPYQEVVSMTESFIRCHVESVQNEEKLHQTIRELCEEPIDVLSGHCLLKASFVTSSQKHIAFLHLHHLISDAKSTQLTNSTMKSFFDDSKKMAKRLKFTYLDYCSLEQGIRSNKIDNDYLKTLVNGLEGLNIGKGERMDPVKVFIDIPKQLISDRLINGKPGDTPFSLLLKMFSSSFTSQGQNFNIAFPVLNRNEKTSSLCGYFLNNLVINTDHLSELPSILNNNLPYSEVMREVRRISGTNLSIADVYVNCRYDLEYDESDDEILLNLVPLKLHFPVEIDVDLMANQTYRITMRSNKISENEIIRMLNKLKKDFAVVRKAQRNEKIVQSGENTLYGARKDVPSFPIPELYEKIFNSNFTSTFATSSVNSESLSYCQAYQNILRISQKLSRDFLVCRGIPIRSDDVIAVIGSKSIETTIKCLAVQFAGAAYLPIDEVYPQKRKREIMRDSVFCFKESKVLTGNSKLVSNRQRRYSISTPFCLSYIISTSGTTGNPKSVAIGADSLSNLCVSSTITMRVSSSSRIFQFTNFVFDNSVLEVSMAISSQASLIYGSPNFDPFEFGNLVENVGITHCLLFPSLVQSFEIERIKSLPYWIVGGERLPRDLLNSALKTGIRVIQNYGPTETTAFAIAKQMKHGDFGCCIGYPAINTKGRITIKESGDQGELLISGKGIMRGYLNRQPSEYLKIIDEISWYSSRDKCRITPNSGVQFIGRTDSQVSWMVYRNFSSIMLFQVKVRGYRIELSEIERTIECHPDVIACKAIFEQESQQIHVFYTGNAIVSSSEVVRKRCEQLLEPQKVPSTFNGIKEFPLTNNSKIDKKKLMEIVKNSHVPNISETCPLETELSSIWMSLLNCSKPSSSDHFFLVGGHSLLLIRLRHLIETKLKVHLSVPEILENLKFEEMLQIIRNKKDFLERKKRRTVVFFPGLYGGCTAYLKMIGQLKNSKEDIENIILLEEVLGNSVQEVASQYKTQIEEKVIDRISSYVFIGASSAGTFAFATSNQFEKEYDIIVILLDSGTFWNRIEKLDYSKHESVSYILFDFDLFIFQDMMENLKNYEVDKGTANRMAESSWKNLQILKNYQPEIDTNSRKINVLSVDGSDLGWSKYSKNSKNFKIPGDHYSMLQDPEHLSDVLKIIEKIIRDQ
ncbi:hypothetical protein CRE_01012 [Caenorhabditis remanei]|uniref:Carrier domain-containing protein n=1 Tax=Caenorhabditis remanei TaxID=31234 RepID=E3MID3_CAERE|nr:hypothetical protein CRE_01012 [Caenorhabditis remanei]